MVIALFFMYVNLSLENESFLLQEAKRNQCIRISNISTLQTDPTERFAFLKNYVRQNKFRLNEGNKTHLNQCVGVMTEPDDKQVQTRLTLLDVPLINQFQGHYLKNGCEITSLAMILNYHGIKVTKTELFQKVDKVPWKYNNGLRGNPNQGFVGDMERGPGLAVYHRPLMKLAKQYVGNRAEDLTGKNIKEIYQKVDQGLPVLVIISATLKPTNDFQNWNTPNGTITVTFHTHSVVITGYDHNYVYVNNPFGYKNQKVERKGFEASWKQLGSQAIVINE